MTFRDLAPWLLAPVALVAAAAPRPISTNGDASLRNAANPALSASPPSGAVAPQAQTPKLLDRYCDDARHLLWKFANASEAPPSGSDKLHLTLSGDAKDNEVSLNEDIDTQDDKNCEQYPDDNELKTLLGPFDLRFLVVTLPDPISTHLPNEFDVGLEAVEAAAAQAHYSMDRFYLPWQKPQEGQTQGARINDEHPASVTRPGIVLFRQSCDQDSDQTNQCIGSDQPLLVVFIAGESPTSGVDKLALASALQQITELAALTRPLVQSCSGRGCIKVGLVAPYFTGSVESLRLTYAAYGNWASQHGELFSQIAPIHLATVSGDAGGVDILQSGLTSFDGASQPPETIAFDRFQATVGFEDDIRDNFLLYLSENLGVRPGEVAILRESDTGYGQSFGRPTFGGLIAYLMRYQLGGHRQEARDLAGRLMSRARLLLGIQRSLGNPVFLAKEPNPQVKEGIDAAALAPYLLRYLESRADALFHGDFKALDLFHQDGDFEGPAKLYYRAANPRSLEMVAEQNGTIKAIQKAFFGLYTHAVSFTTGQNTDGRMPASFGYDNEFVRLRKDYLKRLRYVDLPFPLHISEIRGARPDQSTSPQILNLIQGTGPFFPVLTPTTESKDLVPSFSNLDKASAALVTSNLLSILSTQNIQYVGIAASDVQDTMYLAREVREHCPDATIFVFGSNLLFLNPDIASDLRGTLLVTTYPLLPENQNWIPRLKGHGVSHHQFPSEAAQGLYNATLALLDRPQDLIEYGSPFATDKKTQSPFPPVWITAVGKDRMVPIAVLDQAPGFASMYFLHGPQAQAPGASGASPQTPSKPGPQPCKWSWAVVLAFWFATIVSGCFALVALWPGNLRGYWSIWRARLRSSVELRLLALTAFLLYLFVFYLIFSGLFVFAPWPTHSFEIPGSVRLVSTATAGVLALCGIVYFLKALSEIAWSALRALLDMVRRLWSAARYSLWLEGRAAFGATPWPAPLPLAPVRQSRLGEEVRDFISVMFLLLTPVFLCLLVFGYLGSFSSQGDDYQNAGLIFAAWRYLTPGNGVSPLPPLFFSSLAMVLWAASNVWRSAMLEVIYGGPRMQGKAVQTLQASYLGMSSPSLSDLPQRESEVRSSLSCGALRLRFAPLVVLLLLAVAVFGFSNLRFYDLQKHYVPQHLLHSSVEGPLFDRLFAFLVCIAYTALAFNLFRTHGVWSEFQALLKRLSWHPLREFCGRLGQLGQPSGKAESHGERSAAQVPELSLGAQIPTFTALEFSIEQAQHLVTRGNEMLLKAEPGSLRTEVAARQTELCQLLARSKTFLAAALRADSESNYRKRRKAILKVQAAAARMSGVVVEILEPDWLAPGGENPSTPEERWRDAAGLFLASRILDYSRHILAQLRYLLWFTIVGLLVMLIAVSSYPFPQSDTLLRFGWTMLLAGAAISVVILIEVSRDRILSLLAGGTPGKIDWTFGFVGHLALYGLLPVLTVLGIQFPATLSGIVQWVSSILPGAPGGGH